MKTKQIKAVQTFNYRLKALNRFSDNSTKLIITVISQNNDNRNNKKKQAITKKGKSVAEKFSRPWATKASF